MSNPNVYNHSFNYPPIIGYYSYYDNVLGCCSPNEDHPFSVAVCPTWSSEGSYTTTRRQCMNTSSMNHDIRKHPSTVNWDFVRHEKYRIAYQAAMKN